MIRTFKGKDAEAIFSGRFVKSLDNQIQQRAREKLKYLDGAADLRDLMIPSSNHLESLKGDRAGQTASASTASGVSVSDGGTAMLSTSRSSITTEAGR